MPKLFVYGSLMSDGEFFEQIAEYISNVTNKVFVKGKLFWMGKYPTLVLNPSNNSERVLGEVFDINTEGLVVCDHIEGYNPANHNDSLYRREVTIVYDQIGEFCVALTYVDNSLWRRTLINYWWDNKKKRIESI